MERVPRVSLPSRLDPFPRLSTPAAAQDQGGRPFPLLRTMRTPRTECGGSAVQAMPREDRTGPRRVRVDLQCVVLPLHECLRAHTMITATAYIACHSRSCAVATRVRPTTSPFDGSLHESPTTRLSHVAQLFHASHSRCLPPPRDLLHRDIRPRVPFRRQPRRPRLACRHQGAHPHQAPHWRRRVLLVLLLPYPHRRRRGAADSRRRVVGRLRQNGGRSACDHLCQAAGIVGWVQRGSGRVPVGHVGAEYALRRVGEGQGGEEE